MIILAIDPAKSTGLSMWDTEKGELRTRCELVKNPHDASGALIALQAFSGGIKPDFVIIERPVLPRKGRSIIAYDTHRAVVDYWLTALYGRWGFKPRLQDGRMTTKTKARQVWPATWQSALLPSKGKGRTKAESKALVIDHFPKLDRDLSSDEYDAVCIGLYQWSMCRDLGVKDPQKSRLFEKMRQGGWMVAAPHEMELLK